MSNILQEVSLSSLQYLLSNLLNDNYVQIDQYRHIVTDLLKFTRKIFTFLVVDLPNTNSNNFIMPANICWFQFLNAIKIKVVPNISKPIYLFGILLLKSEQENEFIVCTLVKQDINDTEYSIKFYTLNTLSILKEQKVLFRLLCTCTNAAVSNTKVFKNYEKFNIRKQEIDKTISIYYAPAKIGIIDQDNYTIKYQYSEGSELVQANLEPFSLDRIFKAKEVK